MNNFGSIILCTIMFHKHTHTEFYFYNETLHYICSSAFCLFSPTYYWVLDIFPYCYIKNFLIFFHSCNVVCFFKFLKIFTWVHAYWFQTEGKREKKRNIHVRECLPPINATTGNWNLISGVCPNWGSNLQPFRAWTALHPMEPQRPGHSCIGF